jgi:glycosyltransferase involved in cell wall biosynthesis
MAAIEVSIVMPCLNEAATVGACVRQAQAFLRDHGVRGEVVVADNGSTDSSQAIAGALGARVVAVAARGYGSAIAAGAAAARGAYVIIGDADCSYNFSALLPFLERLRAGCDLVMGNRFAGGVQPGAMPWLHRYVGNPVLSALGRLLFRCPARDFHCGLRGVRKAALEVMDLQTTGMEFASEMVVKATLLGLRIAEVPTTLAPDGRGRPPHLRTWRDGWRHLRFMLLYSPRWLFFYPGAALFLAGVAATLWLLPGPRRVGAVTLDVHTLVYAALAILLGAQMAIFALFTKVFAMGAGLLPQDARFERLFRYVRLETGLLLGGVLVGIGLGGSLWAVWAWGQQAFGPLDPVRALRRVIPAMVALMLGSQVVLSSFFLSVLGLRRRGARFA